MVPPVEGSNFISRDTSNCAPSDFLDIANAPNLWPRQIRTYAVDILKINPPAKPVPYYDTGAEIL
jgi:hypothetical protein